jgi:hypothetical protein
MPEVRKGNSEGEFVVYSQKSNRQGRPASQWWSTTSCFAILARRSSTSHSRMLFQQWPCERASRQHCSRLSAGPLFCKVGNTVCNNVYFRKASVTFFKARLFGSYRRAKASAFCCRWQYNQAGDCGEKAREGSRLLLGNSWPTVVILRSADDFYVISSVIWSCICGQTDNEDCDNGNRLYCLWWFSDGRTSVIS